MKTVEFIITAEIIDEDFSEKETNKILTELEDVIYRNNHELFDSEWFESDI